jgi:acyl carrier protein
MMEKEENKGFSEQLGKLISEKILKQPKRKLELSDKLISSGLIDSFSLVDLALLVEDTYNVHLDDTELNASVFDTLEQLANLIQSRKK